MESQEERHRAISRVILILRKITAAVQLTPFIYNVLYIISFIMYLFAPDWTVALFDHLFYVSTIVVIATFIQSRILKLCKWHRLACLLPLLPQSIIFIDSFIYEFSECGIIINICTMIIMSILLLISAYKVFIK